MKRSYQQRVKDAMILKTVIGKSIHNKRMMGCGYARTLRCKNPNCQAISIDKKYLQYWFCSERFCPLCMMINAQEKSRHLAELVLATMKEQKSKGVDLLPVNICFTLQHKPGDNLKDLIAIVINAWKYMRSAENSSKRVTNHKKGIKSFWRTYFVGEAWSLEMPYNNNSWHVHQHVLALRFLDKPVPIGVNAETGEIISFEGLRSQWYLCVKKAWEEQHKYGDIRPYTEHLREIEEKKDDGTIEKRNIVIPPYVHINSLFYQEKNKKRIPITCLLEKENLLLQTQPSYGTP